MLKKVSIIILIILLFFAAVFTLLGNQKIIYQSCSLCGSIRKGTTGNWEVIYASRGYSSCNHNWESGVSSAVPDPVPEGIIVLLRKRSSYGAFIIEYQTVESEDLRYKWYFRTDGNGLLTPSDPAVVTGTGTGPPISFGPFLVHWSEHRKGKGWLYYPRRPGETIDPNDVHICVTNEKSIKAINAADENWIYKASILD